MTTKPDAFRGADYRSEHFVTPRRCEGFYPDSDEADIVKGDIVVLTVAMVILLISVVWWFA